MLVSFLCSVACEYCRCACGPNNTFELAGYSYCSIECARSHQQTLDVAAAGTATAARDNGAGTRVPLPRTRANDQRGGTRNAAATDDPGQAFHFAESDGTSPPAMPSAGLLRRRRGAGDNVSPGGGDPFAAPASPISEASSFHFHEIDNPFRDRGLDASGGGGAHPPPTPDEPILAIMAPHPGARGGGRTVADEYRDYNDELSRQLRLARRQDAQDHEERMWRRQEFLREARAPRWHDGDGDGGSRGAGSNVNVGESSPDRYQSHLKGMDVNSIYGIATTNKNKNNTNNGAGSKHQTKQNENWTQPTESVSNNNYNNSTKNGVSSGNKHRTKQSENSTQPTSSMSSLSPGGSQPLGGGAGGISPLQPFGLKQHSPLPTAGSGSVRSTESSKASSWGHWHEGTPNSNGTAFNNFVSDGGDGQSGANSAVASGCSHRSLSPSFSTLRCISEEQSFGMAPTSNDDGHGREAELVFLAQRRGWRPVSPTSPRDGTGAAPAGAGADNGASVVYDDPSLDILSMATSDTRTTWSGGRTSPLRGVAQDPGGRTRRRPPRPGGAGVGAAGSRPPGRADPPGSSIDEVLRQRWRGGGGGGGAGKGSAALPGSDGSLHGRDPSIQGLDPSVTSLLSPSLPRVGGRAQYSPQKQDAVTRTPERGPLLGVPALSRPPSQQPTPPEVQAPPSLHNTAGSHWNWQWSEDGPPGREGPVTKDRWQWSKEDPAQREPVVEGGEQAAFPQQDVLGNEDQGRGDDNEFEMFNIEFPVGNEEDKSIGLLTEDADLPPTGSNGDDDTAAGTLDTTDLVAEVRRVWRHVRRYEKKKHQEKQVPGRHGNGSGPRRGVSDLTGDENGLASIDEAMAAYSGAPAVEEEMEESRRMMEVMRQFNEIKIRRKQQEQDYGNAGPDSKVSDITPSSPHHPAAPAALPSALRRGRSPNLGRRRDEHIGDIEAISPTRPPFLTDSPDVYSTPAQVSRTSTERDVWFLNEAVDAFYDEMGDGRGEEGPGPRSSAEIAPAAAAGGNDRARRGGATATIQHYRRLAEQMSRAKVGDDEGEEGARHDQADATRSTPQLPSPRPSSHASLFKPYDITKTKSSGTSFTQKTQKISNTAMSSSTSRLKGNRTRTYMQPEEQGGNASSPQVTSVVVGSGSDPYQHHRHRDNATRKHVQSEEQGGGASSFPKTPAVAGDGSALYQHQRSRGDMARKHVPSEEQGWDASSPPSTPAALGGSAPYQHWHQQRPVGTAETNESGAAHQPRHRQQPQELQPASRALYAKALQSARGRQIHDKNHRIS